MQLLLPLNALVRRLQRGRDKSIAKMSVPELRREVSRMWDHQLQQAQHAEVKQTKRIRRIKKSRSKLDQMDRKKLTDLLFDFDPKRLISNTAVRVPDPQKAKEKQRLDASQAVAAAVSAASRTTSAVAEAAGTGDRAAAEATGRKGPHLGAPSRMPSARRKLKRGSTRELIVKDADPARRIYVRS